MTECRDTSDRLTYYFSHIHTGAYKEICSLIVKHFHLIPIGELVDSLDEKFQDYQLNNMVIGLEWDNWSGFIINAKNKESEQLVIQIAIFIDNRYS